MIRKPHHYLTALALLFLLACNTESGGSGSSREKRTRKQIVSIAETYINDQLQNPEKGDFANGIIEFSDGNRRFILDPTAIHLGLIDDDNEMDAIVTLNSYQGPFQTVSEQLIILGSGRKFFLANVIRADMKIISISDRIIIANVPEHTRDTPLFDCSSCWEVGKFQLQQGELLRIE